MRLIFIILCVGIMSCFSNQEKNNSAAVSVEHQEVPLEETKNFLEGDLIFQTSLSNQSLAIQIATNSKYSHMGMIFQEGENYFVFEAVQPVKLTPLKDWIKRGKDNDFVLKRLKNRDEILTPKNIQKMKSIGERYLGKDYDLKFEWSDDKIYCSELVWKMYKEVFDIEIGQLEKVKDFDLSDVKVQAKLKERYGNNIPLEELVITPDRIFKSEKLETIIGK